MISEKVVNNDTQKEFLSNFKNIKDTCIKYYHCAYRGKILIQGKVYIAENGIYFYSSIFGIKKRIIIPKQDIKVVLKQNPFPFLRNTIKIVTTERSYTFMSFFNRDKTYRLMVDLYQASQIASVPYGKDKDSNKKVLFTARTAIDSTQKVTEIIRDILKTKFTFIHEKGANYSCKYKNVLFSVRIINHLEDSNNITIKMKIEYTDDKGFILINDTDIKIDLNTKAVFIISDEINEANTIRPIRMIIYSSIIKKLDPERRSLALSAVFVFLICVFLFFIQKDFETDPILDSMLVSLQKDINTIEMDLISFYSDSYPENLL